MKVLFVNHTGGMGGAERSLLELVSYLPAFGVEPCVAAPPGPFSLALQHAGARLHALPLRPLPSPSTLERKIAASYAMLANTFLIRRALHAEKPAIVHANSARAAWPSAVAAKTFRAPCVWHCRDLAPPRSAELMRACAGIVAASEAIASSLPPSAKLRTVRNGIDLLHFDPRRFDKPEARRVLEIPADAPLIIMVADLIPWKRHELFLDAAALIAAERPDALFMVAGHNRGEHPELAGALRLKTAALGLTKAVRWLGQCADTARLYAAADTLMHPAEAEPFGRVVCEALAMNCAAVVADAAGPAEIAGDCPAARRVEPGNAAAFAAATLETLDSRLPANAGREHVKRHFDIARTAAELARFYRELRR